MKKILLALVFSVILINIINAGIYEDCKIYGTCSDIEITTTTENITNNYYSVGDGNASSICAGDQVLLGNGSCQTSSDFTGGGAMDYTNVAMTNQSNDFIGNISAQTAVFELTELGKIIMDGVIISKDIIPITHNFYSLGNSSNWFSDIYANYIHAANITATFLNSTNIDSINISSENIQSNKINTTTSQTRNLTTGGFETYYEDGWTKFKLT